MRWWDAAVQMFRTVRMTPEELLKFQERDRQREEQRRLEAPTMFVQVTQPSEETPESTKYYSSVSSRAANPDPGNRDQVKVEGSQSQTLRTEDAPRVPSGRPTPPPKPEPPGPADASPVTPSPPVPQPESVVEPTAVPRLVEKTPEPAKPPGIGELALAKPEIKLPEPQPIVEKPAETQNPDTPVTPDPVPTPAPGRDREPSRRRKVRQPCSRGRK